MKKNVVGISFIFLISILACSLGSAPVHSPTPDLTIALETLISQARTQTVTAAPNLAPTSTPIPTYNSVSAENEVLELSSSEMLNSGTHLYFLKCELAQGNMEDCECETDVQELLSVNFEFEDGKVVFGITPDQTYTFENISNNTYQFIDNEENSINKLLFFDYGFNWEVDVQDDSGICTYEFSFLLTKESTLSQTTEQQTIILLGSGFGQNGQDLGFAFLIENPNFDFAFENTQFLLLAFDENGIEIGTKMGNIEPILPGQTLGVSGVMLLEQNTPVSKIEVQLIEGDHNTNTRSFPFMIESNRYYSRYPNSGIATGNFTIFTFML